VVISTSTLVIISVGQLLQRGIDPWIMGQFLDSDLVFGKKKKKRRKKTKEPVLYTTMEGFCFCVFFFALQFFYIKKLANFSRNSKNS
jgi:hypothetical protein